MPFACGFELDRHVTIDFGPHQLHRFTRPARIGKHGPEPERGRVRTQLQTAARSRNRSLARRMPRPENHVGAARSNAPGANRSARSAAWTLKRSATPAQLAAVILETQFAILGQRAPFYARSPFNPSHM